MPEKKEFFIFSEKVVQEKAVPAETEANCHILSNRNIILKILPVVI